MGASVFLHFKQYCSNKNYCNYTSGNYNYKQALFLKKKATAIAVSKIDTIPFDFFKQIESSWSSGWLQTVLWSKHTTVDGMNRFDCSLWNNGSITVKIHIFNWCCQITGCISINAHRQPRRYNSWKLWYLRPAITVLKNTKIFIIGKQSYFMAKLTHCSRKNGWLQRSCEKKTKGKNWCR